ncbi:MAG: DUF169 domain-containing protein [Archaeoglobaceae archaeon]|nr:DUF169 domain-containing protein [Archaeoglobaceae archaeon]MDW8117935.1 DUF169 domain-containing protein [Archaeoglobaceae archaeon]
MEISELRKKAKELREILGLRSYPVGVKISPKRLEVEAKRLKGFRYCQALMQARKGEHVILGREEIGCAPSASIFGFKPLPEGFRTGEHSLKIGISKDPVVGAKIYGDVENFAPGEVEDLYLFPLETAIMEPDVVIVEDQPEKLMWIMLAYVNSIKGERVELNTAVMRATCLDCTAIPFKRQKINLSFGCFGCRMSTDIGEDEALLGFPFKFFGEIVEFVKHYSQNAIPTARDKKAYKALKAKES